MSSLCSDGSTEALVYEVGMTGKLFKIWVKECLVTTLRKGDIVILDNLSSHKVAGIKELICNAGVTVEYLPQYSPDFNPINDVVEKKKYFRRVY